MKYLRDVLRIQRSCRLTPRRMGEAQLLTTYQLPTKAKTNVSKYTFEFWMSLAETKYFIFNDNKTDKIAQGSSIRIATKWLLKYFNIVDVNKNNVTNNLANFNYDAYYPLENTEFWLYAYFQYKGWVLGNKNWKNKKGNFLFPVWPIRKYKQMNWRPHYRLNLESYRNKTAREILIILHFFLPKRKVCVDNLKRCVLFMYKTRYRNCQKFNN